MSGSGIRVGESTDPRRVDDNFRRLRDAALLRGQIGGQVFFGGAAAGENLELHSNPAKDGLIKLGDSSAYNEATKRLSIGTVASFPSGCYVESAANDLASSQVRAKNTNAAGASAGATLQAIGDVAILQAASYGTGNTTSKFGVTAGAWSELVHNGGNGLLLGTFSATPLVMGASNLELARLDAAAAAANQTNLLLMEGSPRTSRRVKWKDGATLGAGDKVMVLV